MAKYFADLHIHSALSPCGDPDMTPCNIAGMAAIKELDIIALSDHNSAENTPALLSAAEEYGILAIPAMEVTVKEEAHILCYFRTLKDALSYSDYLYSRLPAIPVDLNLFTPQSVLDQDDEVVSLREKLLISAVDIGVDELFRDVSEGLGGAVVPAHIDRKSYSLVTNLGFIPPSLGVSTLEVSHGADMAQWKKNRFFMGFGFTTSSDAHDLSSIMEREFAMELEEKSIDCVINWLKN